MNTTRRRAAWIGVRGGFVVAMAAMAGFESAWPEKVYSRAAQVRSVDQGTKPVLVAPKKQLIPKVKIADAIGWRERETPTAADGFALNSFASQLDHPRWLYVLPNGDVLVAETNAPVRPEEHKGFKGWMMKKAMQKAGAATPSANRITLLRDADGDGEAEVRTTFLKELNSPFGMALVGDDFYVANTDAVLKFNYTRDATSIGGAGERIAELPAGPLNHHWTKNIIASPDGTKLYATVGSNSNVAENGLDKEERRAAILEIDLATRTMRLFASGLRNPNGLDWQPITRGLWTVVNERDEIGDNLVPDYLTSVKLGEFFGWPFSYYGTHIDVRAPSADGGGDEGAGARLNVKVPDYALGSHVAALGLAFYPLDASGTQVFPHRFRGGAFVGLHGSWNRSEFAGYKVAFVPFDSQGRATGVMEDVLTGFLNEQGDARGRPVGVVVDATGALLVADDVGNRIWRVTPKR